MHNTSGRRWAYFGVMLGFTASITANVASTVLKDTDVSLGLRIPFAVFWPLATYVAIEVLVRTVWEPSLSHRLVRVVLAGPVAVVAAFVSYLHQNHLMSLAGEPMLAQAFGPLAVDGMLFGMTAALIVTRPKVRTEPADSPDLDELLVRWGIGQGADWDAAAARELSEAPVSPAPAQRRVPVVTWDARQVAEMILDNEKTATIQAVTGAAPATIGRFRRVTRLLQTDPRTAVTAAEKVRPEHVAMIRELVTR